tara:strand:- start:98 stop:940 length:843 start_codon:yes stop_codon:yes gene_type:complete
MINNITVIIVSYKSEKAIFKCLNSIKIFKKVLILENSGDKKIKNLLKKKYPKVKVYLSSKNLGYGAGYNFLLNKVNTKFAFLITPDASIKKGTSKILLKSIKFNQHSFGIMGPFSQNKNFQINEKLFKKNIYKANHILGFCMLLNVKKIKNIGMFDENFFLYLEDIDLCKRLTLKNKNILINKDFVIDHVGAKSSNLKNIIFLKLRNWHWMWSQYFYAKKYNGNLFALLRFIPKLIFIFLKLIYLLLKGDKNSLKYHYRLKGLYSSIVGKKSYLRPENLN